VASKCGFTTQYAGLEELHQQFKENLVLIGLPCNQFGGQEPGTEKEIQQFCTKKLGVSFLLTEKIKVKGEGKHQLYIWLTDKKKNGKSSSSVKWNFQKYLVSPEGQLIDYYFSLTKPLSSKITKHLK
jgi:glutathione peroxidase